MSSPPTTNPRPRRAIDLLPHVHASMLSAPHRDLATAPQPSTPHRDLTTNTPSTRPRRAIDLLPHVHASLLTTTTTAPQPAAPIAASPKKPKRKKQQPNPRTRGTSSSPKELRCRASCRRCFLTARTRDLHERSCRGTGRRRAKKEIEGKLAGMSAGEAERVQGVLLGMRGGGVEGEESVDNRDGVQVKADEGEVVEEKEVEVEEEEGEEEVQVQVKVEDDMEEAKRLNGENYMENARGWYWTDEAGELVLRQG